MKRYVDQDVLTAARERIAEVFDSFHRVYVSFSGGKDSGVLMELTADEARRRGRTFGCLIIDLEAQYKLTIDYIRDTLARHADVVEPYWVALPLNLRNAVSHFEPQWMCWDPDRSDEWVRQPEPDAITDEAYFPFFRRRMEFEEFVPEFAAWYGDGEPVVCLVGIRSDESLNRYRTIASTSKTRWRGYSWTTELDDGVYNAYPIFDWATEDIWTFYAREERPYNRLYDRMHQAGLTIHQQRICQPYGDDQRRGLWLYSVIEPETWSRVVARVQGANFGGLYARNTGNILGRNYVRKPDALTWEQFSMVLLESMPPPTAEHYKNKIAVFIKWWADHGYPDGIPDDGAPNDKSRPSWTRIAKTLLRFDYHCKGLSFTQTKSDAYDTYMERMRKKREEWELLL